MQQQPAWGDILFRCCCSEYNVSSEEKNEVKDGLQVLMGVQVGQSLKTGGNVPDSIILGHFLRKNSLITLLSLFQQHLTPS